MIRHVVQMTWRPGVTDTEIRAVHDALAPMPVVVPGVRRYEFGDDLGLSDESSDFVVVADFDTVEDYRSYAAHPDHLHVNETVIRPIVASIHRIQYQL